MNTNSILKSVGIFTFCTIITACVIYTLTYAAGVISSPSSTFEMFLGLVLFITSGSVVYHGVRWVVESFIESRTNNQTKENENA
jgi:uncharacterized membrane protein